MWALAYYWWTKVDARRIHRVDDRAGGVDLERLGAP
jgi:hypothetical protein